jgi:hypothetical protein
VWIRLICSRNAANSRFCECFRRSLNVSCLRKMNNIFSSIK